MHILVLHCLISEYWHIVLGYTCSPYKNCKFTHWKFFHPITLWNAMTVWSSSKMWDWHVGCWLPPKMGCKSCKVLLKTDLVVASTVRRHWSSKTRTPKLYTCRDVITYRLSDHASTCQRCVFSAAVTTAATQSPKMPSVELQNRYSSPTWERNTSTRKWRLFGWHHVATPHPTFLLVPKGLQAQCSKQATHTHPIETLPSVTEGVWIEKSWRSRPHQPH